MLLLILAECLALLLMIAGCLLLAVPALADRLRQGRKSRGRGRRTKSGSRLWKAGPCFGLAMAITMGLQAGCDAYSVTTADAVSLPYRRVPIKKAVAVQEPFGEAHKALMWLEKAEDGTDVLIVKRDAKTLSGTERFIQQYLPVNFTEAARYRLETPQSKKGTRLTLKAGTKLKPVENCPVCSGSPVQMRMIKRAATSAVAVIKGRQSVLQAVGRNVVGRRMI